MTGAPGAYLFVIAGGLTFFGGIVAWAFGRTPLLALAVAPLLAAAVISSEELPPSRYDQIVITTICIVASLLAAGVLEYVRWIARVLHESRRLLDEP